MPELQKQILLSLLFVVTLSPIVYAQSENPWIEIGFQGDYRYRVLWNSMARAGDVEAQFNLSLAHSRGERGYPQSHEKAFHWLTLAADRSYPPAENNIGVYHALGRGIAVDHSKALYWFKRAFEHDRTGIGYANIERIQRIISGVDRWRPAATHIPPKPVRTSSTPEPERAKPVEAVPCLPQPPLVTPPRVAGNKKRKDQAIAEKPAIEKHSTPQIAVAESVMPDGFEFDPRSFAPEHFTVQLMGTHLREKALQFIRDGNWSQNTGYVSTQLNARDWFVVVQGDFADKAVAVQTKQQLKGQSKTLNPWIRSFASLTPGHSRQIPDGYELNPRSFAPEHFTLQLMGTHSREKVLQYLRDGNWSQKTGFVSTQRDAKDWFVVVQGDFATKEVAVQTKQQLKGQPKKMNPWIRSFASLTPGYSSQSPDNYELNPCTFAPGHFTLQLMGTHSRELVAQYIRDGNWDQTIGYVSTQRDARDWFVVVYGEFANKEAAARAKQPLMRQSKKFNLWTRSFASLTQGHGCQSRLSTIDQSDLEQALSHTFRGGGS